MQWNTSSFDGIELSELQGIEVKQREREKSLDTSGTRTLQVHIGSTNLNHETTIDKSRCLTSGVVLFVCVLLICRARIKQSVLIKAASVHDVKVAHGHLLWQCCQSLEFCPNNRIF